MNPKHRHPAIRPRTFHDRFRSFRIGAAFIATVLAIVALLAAAFYLFPRLCIGAWLALAAFCFIQEIFRRRKLERSIGVVTPHVEPGVAGEFQGIYSTGFEIGGFAIATGRVSFLFFPTFEHWAGILPPDVEVPPAAVYGSNAVSSFLVRFTATPSALGKYGHKGTSCRECLVHRVIRITPLEESSS